MSEQTIFINPMNEGYTIRSIGPDELETVESLAKEIWPVTYNEILSPDQIAYMLRKMYNPQTLLDQLERQHHEFLIIEFENKAVGFASYSQTAEPGIFKLHKIYLSPALQGKGLGRNLLEFVCEEVKKRNGTILDLNVNRHNSARWFYQKMGFKVIKEEDIGIGNGYFMNDYVMRKLL